MNLLSTFLGRTLLLYVLAFSFMHACNGSIPWNGGLVGCVESRLCKEEVYNKWPWGNLWGHLLSFAETTEFGKMRQAILQKLYKQKGW